MLIRVGTDLGLVGYAPGPASERVAQLINRNLRSALVNADPTKIEALRKKILQRRPQFPGLYEAYGAVEIALLDLKGKAEGSPVSELIGGRTRDRISLYASTGVPIGPEKCCEEAHRVIELGLAGYKVQAGSGPDRELEVVREVRSVLPPQMSLMVDGNAWWCLGEHKYTHPEIDQLVREMSDYGLAWLEEPFDPKDRVAYRRLREKQWIPVAAGRHEVGPDNLMSLAADHIVDVIQANLIYQGGYLTCREVFDVAGRVGLALAFENWGTPLDAVAMAHFGICFNEKTIKWLEWPCLSDGRYLKSDFSTLGQEILREPIPIDAGELIVPKTQGLGIEVNEAVIERYPWKPGPASAFRPYSSVFQ